MTGSSAASYGFGEGQWVFDKNVASNWDNEMYGHIPSYHHVINLSVDLISRLHGKSARILIYWAATGNQIEAYLERGWNPKNIFGMNYSQPLNFYLRRRFPTCPNRLVHVACRPYKPAIDAPFDVVQMHWSLHFEPLNKRAEVLKCIFDTLTPGGTLLLSEKTEQPDVVEKMYHDYKRSKGVNNEEIRAKKNAIRNVLRTLPSHWYECSLKMTGFVDVCIIHSNLGFVTWTARKPEQ